MFLHTLICLYSRFFCLFMFTLICALAVQAQSNSAPVAIPDSYDVHGSLAVWAPGVLGNDYDPDGDPISVQNPSNGGVMGTPHGSIITWSSGGFTYAPQFGYVGTDTLNYSVCDNRGACSNTTTVTFTVTNQPPSAASDTYTVHHTISVAAPGLLGNDSDPEGDAFLVENPSNGG